MFNWSEGFGQYRVGDAINLFRSRGKVIEESLHFACSMGISSPRGDGETFFEARDSLVGTAEFGQSLSGHLIGRNVVVIFLDESSELGEAGVGIALAEVFHGESIAGEGVR